MQLVRASSCGLWRKPEANWGHQSKSRLYYRSRADCPGEEARASTGRFIYSSRVWWISENLLRWSKP